MKENIRIAISGRSGCGNTTVSKMVADTLNLRFINFTFRTLAKEHGLDLKTVIELAEKDQSWDKEVDTRQVKIAREEGGCVLGSRLAIWMLDDADLKVYLKASPQVRAQRIVNREGGTLQEVASFTEERDRQDHKRYLGLYDIDTNDYNFVDMVIDTENLTPAQIVDMIVEKARSIV
jgi:cytidylate kinase